MNLKQVIIVRTAVREWKRVSNMEKEKYKIVALFGPAGSGKDYIQKKIVNTSWGKNNLHEIISCTTRPPRENEVDGVDYHFISTSDEFMNWENLQNWLEFTQFRGWWYGTSIKDLSKDKINIGVFNVQGVKTLLQREDCDVLPVYIYTYDKLRLMRQLVRENNPDCYEICRRFQTDKKDFFNLSFSYRVVENNTDETSVLLSDLILIINNWSQKDK